MSCNNINTHIICRFLYRCKAVNLFIIRCNYDTTRMLTTGSFNIDTTFGKSFNLSPFLFHTLISTIILGKKYSRLLSNGTNCTSLKGMVSTKYFSYIRMSFRLIFSREVKVNIRLLISLKSKESFKWDILAFFI